MKPISRSTRSIYKTATIANGSIDLLLLLQKVCGESATTCVQLQQQFVGLLGRKMVGSEDCTCRTASAHTSGGSEVVQSRNGSMCFLP